MSEVRTIARNTGVLILAEVTLRLLSLIFIIYIARFLGDVGFGKYSFAFAFTNLFVIVSYFGLNMVIVRDVARNKSKADKYLGNVFIIRFILSIITLAIIVFSINLMNYPSDTTTAVYIMGLSVVLGCFASLFMSIFQAFERMEYHALMSIIRQVIVVSFGLFFLFSGYGLVVLMLAFLIGSIFNLLFSFFICIKKFAKPKLEIDIVFWRKLIKDSIPFIFTFIFPMIFFQISIVMLSIVKGDADTGVYSAAFNLIFPLLFIPHVLNMALFPAMSRFFVSSKESLKLAVEKSIKYMFIMALPIAIGATLLADKFILIIFGKEFLSSIVVLQILAWFLITRFMSLVLNTTLGAINRQWFVVLSTFICVIFNIILNFILIPVFSFKGAAIATILTEILLFILLFYFVRKYLYLKSIEKDISKVKYHVKDYVKDYVKIIIGGVLLSLFIYNFNIVLPTIEIINLIAVIFLSAFIYFLILYLLKAFSKEDIQIIKTVLKPLREKLIKFSQ